MSQRPNPQSSGSNSPFVNLAGDAALWVAMVLSLQAFRALMVWLFRAEMSPETDATQLLLCFSAGLRFDIAVASSGILPILALTMASFVRPLGAWHQRVRSVLVGTLVSVALLTFAIDIGYFREYHDQFNLWIFELVFDDRAAIAQTIWKTYPVLWLAVGITVSVAVTMVAGRAFWRAVCARMKLPSWTAGGAVRFVTPVLVVGLAVAGTRGSLGRLPAQLKEAGVTTDVHLNKLVANPFTALRYAIKHQLQITSTKGFREILPDGDIRAAARACFPEAGAETDLDKCTKRIAAGSPIRPPQHVVLIVEESYDAWGMRPEWAALHVTDRLAALGRAGIAADAFVSAGRGTMPSLAALITGLPDAGVRVNYQASSKRPFPTAAAPTFKRLGYRTRFYYGGYLSWQRLDEFCRNQGFDHAHGRSEMRASGGNEWGVDDEDLFRFVLSQLGTEPSFHMIMTTSYHTPHSVDFKARGFPPADVARELTARGFAERDIKILGTLWYADKALGDFVEAVTKQFPRTLFAVTGDHWSRHSFSSPPPTRFEQRAVPFVLYGPDVLQDLPRPPRIAGSHSDILPTLVELCAPSGFEYHSFGRNMLDPAQPQIGFGNSAVVTPDTFVDVDPRRGRKDKRRHTGNDQAEFEQWRLRYQQLHALSWWRVMKGSEL